MSDAQGLAVALPWHVVACPGTRIIHISRPSMLSMTGVGAMHSCPVAVNAVAFGLPQIANFESLLRRLMRKAPSAAFLLLENFVFKALAPKGEAPSTPLPYYHTGDAMSFFVTTKRAISLIASEAECLVSDAILHQC
jgi:hypothetical protein